MNCVTFSGPSLSPLAVPRYLPAARCLGPAQCGDIYRAQAAGAHVIVLIDGFFEHVRPVWHKELLWALSRGVEIYGAASLGALRAVELEPYGMIGVGEIFAWYKSGQIEDDDEVTLIHEGPERNYQPKSEALVNLRATLALAVSTQVMPREHAQHLLALQKARFYAQRSFDALVRSAQAQGLPIDAGACIAWYREHAIDQKREDAIAALQRVAARIAGAAPKPPRPDFTFSYTEAWHEFVRRVHD